MRKAFIQLHIAIFLAGFTAVLGRLILLNEAVLVWYRLLISIVVLLVMLIIAKRLRPFAATETLKAFGVGAVIAFHWLCFYGSVKYGNISISLVCLSSMAFFTSFIEPIILKRKIDWVEVFLGALSILGIYIIFNFNPQFKLGILFGILAAIGSSIFPVLNKQMLAKHPPRMLMFTELTGGFLFLTLATPIYLKFFPAEQLLPTTTDWLWLVVLAVLCTVVAFELGLHALTKISPFTSSLSYNLEPLYGIVMGFVFFNEGKYFHKGFYWGIAIIALTIILHTIRVVHLHRQEINATEGT